MIVCKWFIQFKAHNGEKTVITLWKNTITESWHNQLHDAESSLISQYFLYQPTNVMPFMDLSVPSCTNNSLLSEPNPNHINPLSHPEDGGIFLHKTGTSLKKLLHTTLYICSSLVCKISFNIICQEVLPFWLFNYNSVNISPSIRLHVPPFFIWFTLTFGDKYKYSIPRYTVPFSINIRVWM